jgi:molybdopterin/thiamine biosynthesis adenylyltransferase
MSDGRWSRLEAVVDLEALAERHVLVAGVGSGGSTVALELAKSGVGRLTLVDPDRLEPQNVVRHECDDRSLGRNKAEAVAELILHRNPGAHLEAIARDLFELSERLPALVADADVVAVCTDKEPPKHLLNRVALGAGVPAVYGGVYARGVGGEVIACGAGPKDPCYACVTAALKGSTSATVDDEVDYGQVGDDGTLQAVPGLGLDVRLVALLHAKVCLALLIEGHPHAPALLLGTAEVPGLFPRPFATALVNVARREACMVCGPINRAAV